MSKNIGTFPTLWDNFFQLSAIPRPSQQEQKIRKWLLEWAQKKDFKSKTDAVGNVIISVPAHNCNCTESIVLQAHMDMVCEKEDWSTHNFHTDPIPLYVDGDWIRAKGTTLGSDNGIGLAIAMAVATDNSIARPPLTLLFTVDEETGLTGAAKLASDQLDSNYLINLDSEDDATIIVGCAGGQNLHVSFKHRNLIQIDQIPNHYIGCRITFRGYAGGHSGVDIAEPVGNPILDIARYIELCNKQSISPEHEQLYFIELAGGTVHNAIPRTAEAITLIPLRCFTDMQNLANIKQQQLSQQYHDSTSAPEIVLETIYDINTQHSQCYDYQQSLDIVSMLTKLPQGVFQLLENSSIPSLSSNVSSAHFNQINSEILVSFRGLEKQSLEKYVSSISTAIAHKQFNIKPVGYYPPWSPLFDSELLAWAKTSYKKILGIEPKIEVIHAGLETAVIAASYPNMQMISCGPLLLNPHSPAECLNITSTEKIYRFVQELLHTMAHALQ